MKTPIEALCTLRRIDPRYVQDMEESEYHNFDAYGSTLVRAADRSINDFRDALTDEYKSESMKKGDVSHLIVLEPERFRRMEKSVPPARPGSDSWRSKHLETASHRRNPNSKTDDCTEECVDQNSDTPAQHAWECVAERKTTPGTTPSKCQEYSEEEGFDALLEHYSQEGVEYQEDTPKREYVEAGKQLRHTLQNFPLVPDDIFESCRTEVSIFWSQKSGGRWIPLKGRIDIEMRLEDGKSILWDYKSQHASSRPHKAKKRISSYKSHAQAAQYIRGYEEATGREVVDYYYLMSQYEAPFNPWVYRLSTKDYNAGTSRVSKGLTNIFLTHDDPDRFGGPEESMKVHDTNLKPYQE